MPICPTCESALDLPADTVPGEVIPCSGCDAELEVLATDPLEIAIAPEMEEDWGE